ncbi:GTPase IMAP family member 9-like [Ruditapes philippinarum]|uniref:GTPase IMAP family member 9-like n=1 Tax=Ruditapes philippinarum TaxID=129788 RepID=UPI00295B9A33|nr:GTPase IMAP family member 9-like [Ruditapes philippinarum]
MAQNIKKVIIVGKTGNGKSSLGNSLLGMKLFKEGGGFNASSLSCQVEKKGQFEIVDTPGFFDTNQNRNVARQAEVILDSLKLCPEPHAFLIVIKYSRFTAEEVSVLDVLAITFGEQYIDHAIVVVTHVDNDVTDADFRDACRESHQVNELLKRCGRRVVRIDNKNPNREHITTLLKYIDQVSKDGKSCFNNDYLRCHDEVLRRSAQDLNKYDGMLVHEQVEQIATEIKTMVNEEITRAKKESEERAKREQEEREERAKREKEKREKKRKKMEEKEERDKEEKKQQKEKENKERNWNIALGLLGAGIVVGKLFLSR